MAGLSNLERLLVLVVFEIMLAIIALVAAAAPRHSAENDASR